MKNRTNQILLAVLLVTAGLYALLLLSWLEIILADFPLRQTYLALGFHIVPCFCLQLLLCRMVKGVFLRLIPVFLLAGSALMAALFLSTSSGWDALGWGLLLAMCIAPTVGFVLAWVTYCIQWALYGKP